MLEVPLLVCSWLPAGFTQAGALRDTFATGVPLGLVGAVPNGFSPTVVLRALVSLWGLLFLWPAGLLQRAPLPLPSLSTLLQTAAF